MSTTPENPFQAACELQSLTALLQRRAGDELQISPREIDVPGKGASLATAVLISLTGIVAIDLCIAVLAGWISCQKSWSLKLTSNDIDSTYSTGIPQDLANTLRASLQNRGVAELEIQVIPRPSVE